MKWAILLLLAADGRLSALGLGCLGGCRRRAAEAPGAVVVLEMDALVLKRPCAGCACGIQLVIESSEMHVPPTRVAVGDPGVMLLIP